MCIDINVKFKRGLRGVNRSSLLVLFTFALLVSSLFAGLFAPNAEGQSSIRIGTESELKEAINSAESGISVVIALDKSIALTGTLSIPYSKDITLKSDGNSEAFKLFGASGQSTVTVENGGILRLTGVTVTHASGASGVGVDVNLGGTLVMLGGAISDNAGVGVSNLGDFSMSGGTISGNTYGGVSNGGTFTMTSGSISENVANDNSGDGGGVYNGGTFTMSNGEISGNSARGGGGVYNRAAFTMTGGKLFGNNAGGGGGGVNNYYNSVFSMSGGEISGNDANWGGGVNNYGTFSLSGGTISSNNARNAESGGGGVSNNDSFDMSGGSILNNMAINGGGVYNKGVFV